MGPCCLHQRNVQQLQGGLEFKAHRLCESLNSRLGSNKEGEKRTALSSVPTPDPPWGKAVLPRIYSGENFSPIDVSIASRWTFCAAGSQSPHSCPLRPHQLQGCLAHANQEEAVFNERGTPIPPQDAQQCGRLHSITPSGEDAVLLGPAAPRGRSYSVGILAPMNGSLDRETSLITKRQPLGPYSRHIRRAQWLSQTGRGFL